MKVIGLIAFVALLAAGYFFLRFDSDPPAPAAAPEAATPMTRLATDLLAGLDSAQREDGLLPFESEERKHWNYTPYPHRGVDWRTMRPQQRELVISLLQTVLSDQGYQKTRAIMELENILREIEDRPADDERRNPERYYFTVFGTPSDSMPWGWRFEGHHVSLNFSSVGRQLAATPSFFGSNPHRIPMGPREGERVLDQEEDLAREFMALLSPEQQATAIIAEEAPADLLTANHPTVDLEGFQGIAFPALDEDQQQALLRLLQHYLDNLKPRLSEHFWQRIQEADIDALHFAWAGTLTPGEGHYYRLHGPVLLIEYDNTQNDNNHVHCVLRDPTNDWGEDLLRLHYEQAEHHDQR